MPWLWCDTTDPSRACYSVLGKAPDAEEDYLWPLSPLRLVWKVMLFVIDSTIVACFLKLFLRVNLVVTQVIAFEIWVFCEKKSFYSNLFRSVEWFPVAMMGSGLSCLSQHDKLISSWTLALSLSHLLNLRLDQKGASESVECFTSFIISTY